MKRTGKVLGRCENRKDVGKVFTESDRGRGTEVSGESTMRTTFSGEL